MKKHNGIIGLWKFIFCMLIVFLHIGADIPNTLFKHGAIGVEFFFLVSGYLLAKSATTRGGYKSSKKDDKNLGKETGLFIFKKYKSFFPYLLISLVFGLIIKAVLHKISIKLILFSVFDLLAFNFIGYARSGIIDPIWYVSAMFLCMAIIYPQMRKYKDKYFYFLGPLQAIVIAGIYYHLFHTLKNPGAWLGLTYRGNIRAFFEIHIGACLYPLVQKIKSLDFTKLGSICITLIEIVGFVTPILAAQFLSTSYDYILLLMLMCSVTLAFSEKTLEFKFLNNKFIYFLEKISIPVYFIHVPIRDYIRSLGLTYKECLISITLTSIVAGIIMVFVVDFLKKREFYIPKIKKLFIN